MDEEHHIAVYSILALVVILVSAGFALQSVNKGVITGEFNRPTLGNVCGALSQDIYGPCIEDIKYSSKTNFGNCPPLPQELIDNPRMCTAHK